MMKLIALSRLALAAAFLSAIALPASAAVLYDGTDVLQPLPADQGWAYGTNPLFGASATQTNLAVGVRLDSTPVMGEMAGYFSEEPVFHSFSHPGMQPLDRTAGYIVTFDVKVNSESHVSNDRAGFSIIAISSDLMGIELGFWQDRIFAQEAPGFTHAEEAVVSTAAMTRYELSVAGASYELLAGGSATPILTGGLRDYSPAVVPVPDVYEIPSFLFLGDDTSSAEASVDIEYIELVPEPATLALLGVGGLAMLRRRLALVRRRRA